MSAATLAMKPDHLQVPDMMRVAFILQDKRNPLCPIKWTVTASQRLEDLLAKAENKKPASG
jgi:hypothetical protein